MTAHDPIDYPLGNRYVDRMDVMNPLDYTPQLFDVVIGVDRTQSGNTVLRVGTNQPGTAVTVKTGHIVLTPDEREELIDKLRSHRMHYVPEGNRGERQ